MVDTDKSIDKRIKEKFLVIDKKIKDAFSGIKQDIKDIKNKEPLVVDNNKEISGIISKLDKIESRIDKLKSEKAESNDGEIINLKDELEKLKLKELIRKATDKEKRENDELKRQIFLKEGLDQQQKELERKRKDIDSKYQELYDSIKKRQDDLESAYDNKIKESLNQKNKDFESIKKLYEANKKSLDSQYNQLQRDVLARLDSINKNNESFKESLSELINNNNKNISKLIRDSESRFRNLIKNLDDKRNQELSLIARQLSNNNNKQSETSIVKSIKGKFKPLSIDSSIPNGGLFWKVLPYVFLAILFILAINQYFKWSFISDYNIHLSILGIITGGATFWKNRNKIENSIDDDKKKEGLGEQSRKLEFSSKFPKINKIWGLRTIVKWMYREGWAYSGLFLIITLLFIIVKIYMVLRYTGSYIDEYYHIFSGIDLFTKGNLSTFIPGDIYTRGVYVSFFVGLFFKFFGSKLFVAKLVPAFIGLISYFLLAIIGKRLNLKKSTILLILLVYSVSPWVILNQFYIRMYAFYELFILLSINLIISLDKKLSEQKIKSSLLYLGSIIIFVMLMAFLSQDNVFYLLAILISLPVLGVYFKYLKNNHKNILKIIFLLLGFIIILAIFLSVSNKVVNDKIIAFFSGSPDNGFNVNLIGYFNFIFISNSVFTILILSSTVERIRSLKIYGLKIENILFFFLIFFLAVHLLISKSLQFLRVFIYIMPLFYLFSLQSIDNLKKYKVFIIIILLIFITLNFPKGFFETPQIPNEGVYLGSDVYSKVILLCNNSTVITSQDPAVMNFFGVRTDYLLRDIISNSPNIYYNNKTNSYVEFYSNISVITNVSTLNKIIINAKKDICYVEREPVNLAFVSQNMTNLIKEKFVLEGKYQNLNLFIHNNRKTISMLNVSSTL